MYQNRRDVDTEPRLDDQLCDPFLTRHQAKKYLGKPLCLFTDPDPAAKVNILLMACLFMVRRAGCEFTPNTPLTTCQVLVEGRCPWTVYSLVAHMELIMFRDAGSAANEFGLSFQVGPLVTA